MEAVQEDHPMHGWDKCTSPLALPGASKTIVSLVDAMRVASQAADPAYHVDPLPHSSTKLSHASGYCSNMAMLVKMPTPRANKEAVEHAGCATLRLIVRDQIQHWPHQEPSHQQQAHQ